MSRDNTDFIIKAYYFLFSLGLGCIGTFLPAYLKAAGFSGVDISDITSLGALCGVLGVPLFWGWLSDRLKRPDLVLKIMTAGTLIGCIPLLFFQSFWAILCSFMVYSFCSIGVMGNLDAMASIRAKERGLDFGRMRLFTPAGYFVGSIFLGYYLDLTGKAWNDVSVILAIVLSFSLLMFVVFGLHNDKAEKQERPTLAEVMTLFKSRYIVLFLIMAMVNMMGITAYYYYFGPLIQHLGFDPSILGLSIGVGTLSEVIFMFYFDKFKRWLGLDMLIILSIAVSIIRWVIIANTSSVFVIVGIQVLHSEVGLFVLACVSLVSDTMPKKIILTGQMLFYMVTFGWGFYLGNKLMGYLFDQYMDPSKLFIIASYIHIVPLLIAVYNYYYRKRNDISQVFNQS